jgi:hypothetical protein
MEKFYYTLYLDRQTQALHIAEGVAWHYDRVATATCIINFPQQMCVAIDIVDIELDRDVIQFIHLALSSTFDGRGDR